MSDAHSSRAEIRRIGETRYRVSRIVGGRYVRVVRRWVEYPYPETDWARLRGFRMTCRDCWDRVAANVDALNPRVKRMSEVPVEVSGMTELRLVSLDGSLCRYMCEACKALWTYDLPEDLRSVTSAWRGWA